MFKLMDLPYSYDALEPVIDAKTLELHHSKHHQGYVDKLNKALENYPEFFDKTVEEILSNVDVIPEEIRTKVIFHGGGTANHNLFWQVMRPPQDVNLPSGKIAELIDRDFGSFEEFRQKFTEMAVPIMGSGWQWLILNKGKLELMHTQNHDSPLSLGFKPLLVCDVWEHSYYLKYLNKRNEFVESFFKLINWDKVNELIESS